MVPAVAAPDLPLDSSLPLRLSRRAALPFSFTYCALLCCAILGRLDALNVPAAVDYILACKNFDGGFGCRPGALAAGRLAGLACSSPLLACQLRWARSRPA